MHISTTMHDNVLNNDVPVGVVGNTSQGIVPGEESGDETEVATSLDA